MEAQSGRWNLRALCSISDSYGYNEPSDSESRIFHTCILIGISRNIRDTSNLVEKSKEVRREGLNLSNSKSLEG